MSSINGGSFSDDVDGGEILRDSSYTFTLSSSSLSPTGNMYASYFSGYDAFVSVTTGMNYSLFKITCPYSTSETLTGAAAFSILPSDSYKMYDSINNIIYIPDTGDGLTPIYVSGEGHNGQISSAELYSSSRNVSNFLYTPNENTVVSPADHYLIVYNTSFQESIDIKNYYTGMRTGIANANILGISCNKGYSGARTDFNNYHNNIKTPIYRHIITGGKPIKYVCLMHGIPVHVTGIDLLNPISGMISYSIAYDLSTSMNHFSGYSRASGFASVAPRQDYLHSTASPNVTQPFLFEEYSGNTALFCHLATLENKTNHLSGYIRKICEGGRVSGAYLLGSGSNTTFLTYWDDPQYGDYTNFFPRGSDYYASLGVNLSKSRAISNGIAMTGKNVGGFSSNGWHGGRYIDGTGNVISGYVNGGWATSPSLCTLSGYNWYIESHYESYAGNPMIQYEDGSHSPFEQHIRNIAMGGANYNNVPVGFVGSIIEPGLYGIESTYMFDAWFNGVPFIDSAYIGMNYRNYAIMGDPFVKWR